MPLFSYKRPLLALYLFCLLPLPTDARAENWFVFDPIRVEATIDFDAFLTSNSRGTSTKDYKLELGVNLLQDGYILDPGIANFSLRLEPRYAWQKIDNSFGAENLKGHILNYGFQLGLFRGMPTPIKVGLGASRNSGINTGTLGSRSDFSLERYNADISWVNTAFPMRLSYRQDLVEQTYLYSFSPQQTERNELFKVLQVYGNSSKTKLRIEHQDMDDRVVGRNQDYTLDIFDLKHRFLWGTDSQLTSRALYEDRTGSFGRKRFRIDETADIHHTDALSSRTFYQFSSVGRDFKTDVHTGEINLRHLLYSNLSSHILAGGTYIDTTNLNQTTWKSGVGTQYSKDFWGAAVTAGVDYIYSETDRDSNAGLIEVIDESQKVPEFRTVLLNRRYILIPTIIVTNVSGTIVYLEGLDYNVLESAGNLTQLQITPGGQINTGDTILVSYKAYALPPAKFSSTNTAYNIGINLGWIRAAHFSKKFDSKLISGATGGLIPNNRHDSTTLDLNWTMGKVTAWVNMERRFNRTNELEVTNYTFRQRFDWSAFGNTSWHLNLTQLIGKSNIRKSHAYNIRLTVSWAPLPGLSVNSNIGAWQQGQNAIAEDVDKREDTYLNFGINATYQFRKLYVNLNYQHNTHISEISQQNDEWRNKNDLLMLRVRRRF